MQRYMIDQEITLLRTLVVEAETEEDARKATQYDYDEYGDEFSVTGEAWGVVNQAEEIIEVPVNL